MTWGQNSADAAPLIVEFPLEGGVRAIARTPADLAAKSSEVIDEAMGTISEMSSRFRRTVEQMPVRPSQIDTRPSRSPFASWQPSPTYIWLESAPA